MSVFETGVIALSFQNEIVVAIWQWNRIRRKHVYALRIDFGCQQTYPRCFYRAGGFSAFTAQYPVQRDALSHNVGYASADRVEAIRIPERVVCSVIELGLSTHLGKIFGKDNRKLDWLIYAGGCVHLSSRSTWPAATCQEYLRTDMWGANEIMYWASPATPCCYADRRDGIDFAGSSSVLWIRPPWNGGVGQAFSHAR